MYNINNISKHYINKRTALNRNERGSSSA